MSGWLGVFCWLLVLVGGVFWGLLGGGLSYLFGGPGWLWGLGLTLGLPALTYVSAVLSERVPAFDWVYMKLVGLLLWPLFVGDD